MTQDEKLILGGAIGGLMLLYFDQSKTQSIVNAQVTIDNTVPGADPVFTASAISAPVASVALPPVAPPPVPAAQPEPGIAAPVLQLLQFPVIVRDIQPALDKGLAYRDSLPGGTILALKFTLPNKIPVSALTSFSVAEFASPQINRTLAISTAPGDLSGLRSTTSNSALLKWSTGKAALVAGGLVLQPGATYYINMYSPAVPVGQSFGFTGGFNGQN